MKYTNLINVGRYKGLIYTWYLFLIILISRSDKTIAFIDITFTFKSISSYDKISLKHGIKVPGFIKVVDCHQRTH